MQFNVHQRKACSGDNTIDDIGSSPPKRIEEEGEGEGEEGEERYKFGT